mmetsp:Transcript_18736/g.44018  ORF Transcript_18736/g.44018 Transcript_18736/m.44018 type:complete len:107 (+) Transcript_18736:1004-1324(+)
MADVAEVALVGGHMPLHDEIATLGRSVASPDQMELIRQARNALLEKSNEHVLLDTAGIIGFFATITLVVDFAGHYSDKITNMLAAMSKILSGARQVRQALCCCCSC